MKSKILGLLAVGLLAGPMVANAVPVVFTYTDTISNSNNALIANGDTMTLEVVMDNGGNSLISQTWSPGNLISGLLTAGSYFQSFNAGLCGSFTTNAAGAVSNAICGTYGDNTDSFGSGSPAYLYNNAVQDFNGNTTYFDNGSMSARRLNWTVRFVPEPGTLALLCLGLAGLGLSRRRKAN